ncbi:FkbM family methyltransferase [Tsuneonella amylolytica]|uniref:FkbM family methyltransferase n=1 Tax=Tsuneonella amylolytica TaxID=2338327 RepID=UPI0013C40BCD|nr:FkbM family methyltransferase [Tsuneonella amylolytica]
MTTAPIPYYSQFGEDRGLEKIFGGKRDGFAIEVGANNGVDGSTTLHFEKLGWECILVEPNPSLCAEIRTKRAAMLFECAASSAPGTAVLQIAVGAEGSHAVSALGDSGKAAEILQDHGFRTEPVEVATRTMDAILEEAAVARPIDFVSIDVEGHELEMLKGFSLDRWRPRILIIEDNASLGEGSVKDHLEAGGYVRFRRTGVNDWYAHRGDTELAGPLRRAAYYPSMVYGRAVALLLRAATPVAPILKRVPGAMAVRNLLLGGRRG